MKPVAASCRDAGHFAVLRPIEDGAARRRVSGLPATNRSAIDVNEVRTRIIADTSAPEAQRRIADLAQIAALRSQIDGHPFDMIAIFRHPLVMQVETSVGGRRAIPANYEERIVRIEPITQVSEHVQNTGIHRPDLVGMVIPQDPVDVPDRLPNVVTVGPIDCPQPFTGMDVVERNRSRSERNCRNRIYETNGGGCRCRTEKVAAAQ